MTFRNEIDEHYLNVIRIIKEDFGFLIIMRLVEGASKDMKERKERKSRFRFVSFILNLLILNYFFICMFNINVQTSHVFHMKFCDTSRRCLSYFLDYEETHTRAQNLSKVNVPTFLWTVPNPACINSQVDLAWMLITFPGAD